MASTGSSVVDTPRPVCPQCGFGMVRRTRRADGAEFWGCPRYPECRGTRAIEDVPAPAPVEAAPTVNRDRAGASAERQFERRRAKHEERTRAARPDIIGRGVLLAVVGLTLVTAAPGTWPLAGWGLVFVAIVSTAGRLFLLPQHVAAWDAGVEGERRTAAALEPLRADGFTLLHDRRVQMSIANIDQIVVGPSGIWVIETKNYGGRVRVERGELRVDGRRRAGVFEEVEREGTAVARVVVPHGVKPLIVVHRADLPLLGWPNLRGVPIVTAREAVKRIRRGPAILSPEQVAELVARIDAALPPALGG